MSVTKNDLEELQKIFQTEDTITQTAKTWCEKNNVEYNDNIRRRVSKLLNSVNSTPEPDEDFDNETDTKTNQYSNDKEAVPFMPSAWDADKNRFLNIDEFCEKYGLPKEDVRSSKLITHNSSNITYNIAFRTSEEEVIMDIQEHLDSIIKTSVKPIHIEYKRVASTPTINNLTYTDSHVGLEPNKEGNSLYGGKWNREELFDRLKTMVAETVNYSIKNQSEILYIRDLGDTADGYNEETTRGGHKLPQNMSNVEAFDAALSFKVSMVDALIATGHYSQIVCENVCNSNHGGDFDYFINSAFKGVVETKYENVKVTNHRQFISHYGVGQHCFLITHGKDIKDLKFAMKPILDSKTIEKIDHYIKSNNLYTEYKYFHLCKGDSHQFLLDFSTSQDFDYFNYPALSPSSQWVQSNFKQGLSGFVLENFHPEEEEIDFKYKKFKWKK